MADVADKAVDKLGAVVDALSRLAPDVWASAVRSERVEGISNCVILVGFVVATALVTARFWRWVNGQKDKNGPEVVLPVLALAVTWAVAVGILIGNLGTELSRAVSPEYYAASHFMQVLQ